MTYYSNANKTSTVAGMEVIPSPQGNFGFFYGASSKQMNLAAMQLTVLGQTILAEATLGGKPVLITKGDKTEAQLIKAFAAQNESLQPVSAKKPFQPWKLRGYFSDAGMLLTLLSAKFSGQKLDASKLTFAGLGLSANAVNKIYGAQREDDPHRLNFLKKRISNVLQPYMASGQPAPHGSDRRAALQKEHISVQTMRQKTDDFMRRHSVRFGEIGLRYVAAVAMVLSPSQFKEMGELRDGGKLVETFNWGRAREALHKGTAKNAWGLLNTNKTNLLTGGIYLAGRTLSLVFAKTPDPYNPKPKSALTTFREKYAFRISSVIEACAAATLSLGSLKVNKTTGKRDWIGGIGGASLMAGLITRIFAPFGVREINMDELYAHIAANLARVPNEKLPMALADSARVLKEDFKGRPETFGVLFTAISDRLYHDYGISTDPVSKADANAIEPIEAFKHAARFRNQDSSYQKRLESGNTRLMTVA